MNLVYKTSFGNLSTTLATCGAVCKASLFSHRDHDAIFCCLAIKRLAGAALQAFGAFAHHSWSSTCHERRSETFELLWLFCLSFHGQLASAQIWEIILNSKLLVVVRAVRTVQLSSWYLSPIVCPKVTILTSDSKIIVCVVITHSTDQCRLCFDHALTFIKARSNRWGLFSFYFEYCFFFLCVCEREDFTDERRRDERIYVRFFCFAKILPKGSIFEEEIMVCWFFFSDCWWQLDRGRCRTENKFCCQVSHPFHTHKVCQHTSAIGIRVTFHLFLLSVHFAQVPIRWMGWSEQVISL